MVTLHVKELPQLVDKTNWAFRGVISQLFYNLIFTLARKTFAFKFVLILT